MVSLLTELDGKLLHCLTSDCVWAPVMCCSWRLASTPRNYLSLFLIEFFVNSSNTIDGPWMWTKRHNIADNFVKKDRHSDSSNTLEVQRQQFKAVAELINDRAKTTDR